ncbi:MAG: hypothetical protein ACSHX6_00550 [Akkermansiaceae bacterium]
MKPIESSDEAIYPLWDSFGIRLIDFRPNWDGDYVNVFTCVEPQVTEEVTEEMMKDCARQLARWILENKDGFGKDDRFLIIIGWPKSFREAGRQVIRTGGTYEELSGVVSGDTSLVMKKGWSKGVFN